MALSIISSVQWKWACNEVGNTVWMAWCQTINFHMYQHCVNTAGGSIRKSWSILYCKMHYLIYAGTVTTGVAVRAGRWILWGWKSWRRSEWILCPVSAGTAALTAGIWVLWPRDHLWVSRTVRKRWDPPGQMRQKYFCRCAGKAAEENFNLGMDRDSWWQWHKWGNNGPDLVGKRCMAGVLPRWREAL